MKSIVMLDMDGTLTEPRGLITRQTTQSLKRLENHADLAVVSGSPYDYIKSQMSSSWDDLDGLDPQRLKIFPCNGTKKYEFSKSTQGRPQFVITYDNDMIQHIGKQNYRILVSILTDLQNDVVETYKKIPLSGNFISFRGSMVNWCMIGRDATNDMRRQFTRMDDGLRKSLKKKLDDEIKTGGIENMTTSMGGSTSIDIYPSGWDKTYSLKHVQKYQSVFFIGDKCDPGGNDYEIYSHPDVVAYKTSGPECTRQIIDDIVKRISE